MCLPISPRGHSLFYIAQLQSLLKQWFSQWFISDCSHLVWLWKTKRQSTWNGKTVASISSTRQAKLPTELRWLLAELFQRRLIWVSTFNLFQEVDPLKLKRGPTTFPFIACFRQSASSKTFLFFLSKGRKNYKKNIIENGNV